MNESIFKYNKDYFGGTEIMVKGFIEKILPEMTNIYKYKNIVLPGELPDIRTMGVDGNKYIIWIHNNISQFDSRVKDIFTNKLIKQSIEKIVVVSEYEKQVVAKEIDFDLNKIIVIPNAIEPITPLENKFNNISKVKLIHASTSHRGMDILLKAIPLITEDFELNIFNDFYPDFPHNYNLDGVNDPRVNIWGKTPRKIVYKFMSEAHIHAYPSTYPETSCLAQMEALSAGCYSVVTNLGALPETSMGHGVMIPIQELSPERYAEELTKAIISIKQNGYDYAQQRQDIIDNFSWDKAKQNWLELDKTI